MAGTRPSHARSTPSPTPKGMIMPTILAGRLEGSTHALSPATTTSAWARPAGPGGSQPGDGRDADSAPEWKPRMPRLNTALALNLVLMLPWPQLPWPWRQTRRFPLKCL